MRYPISERKVEQCIWQTATGELTRNEPVSLEVLFAPLCQEDIGLVQKENTVPSVGQGKVDV
jgi:hypothetical protein